MTITVGGKNQYQLFVIAMWHFTYWLMYIRTLVLLSYIFTCFSWTHRKLYTCIHGMIYDLKHKLIFHFMCSFLFYALQRFDIFQVISSMVGYPYQDNVSVNTPWTTLLYSKTLVCMGIPILSSHEPFGSKSELIGWPCPRRPSDVVRQQFPWYSLLKPNGKPKLNCLRSILRKGERKFA